MRVNDVMPSTRDGNTVSAVINAKICNDNEYDVDPSATSLATSAGSPAARPFITAGTESWAEAAVSDELEFWKRRDPVASMPCSQLLLAGRCELDARKMFVARLRAAREEHDALSAELADVVDL